jgi:hypothetical protein
LSEASRYLKADWTFERLDALAKETSDNEAARRMTKARDKLFQALGRNSEVA